MPVDFIEPSSLGQARYKVVIVPWHLIGKKETCAQLQRFAESGGILILETAFGLFDDHCIYNPVAPPAAFEETEEAEHLSGRAETRHPVALAQGQFRHPASRWLRRT